MSDIWRSTRNASVVLADVTGKNSNVFYELGLAHASKRPVILITGSLEDVPFDLKRLRVIEYNKDDENRGSILKDRITDSLRAALSDPTVAIPATFLESTVDAAHSTDPLSLQLRQISGELRALRASISPKASPSGEARRLIGLLERHSNYFGMRRNLRVYRCSKSFFEATSPPPWNASSSRLVTHALRPRRLQ